MPENTASIEESTSSLHCTGLGTEKILKDPTPNFHLRSAPVYKYQDPFEHYWFSKESGRGGYATVYFCQHLDTREEYACKVVHTREDKNRVQRALKEACMQVSVHDHPNVTTLKEVWVTGASQVFLVMEKCEGGEVFDAIASRGALPETEAASVLRVVLQVALYFHDRHLVHHDLKPENFMLKDKDKGLSRTNIRAIDFGSTDFADTSTPKVSGTPQYAAPELIMGPQHDHRADVWSAGVFLYCMLSGLTPFGGDNHMEVKRNVVSQPIDFAEDPWPFVSDCAKDLCQRLLTRDVQERISLRDALRHPWMREHSFQATPAELQSLGDRLQRFCQLTHVQRHLMLEYAKGFAEAHSSQKLAYDCFFWMDMDGDGSMNLADFQLGIADLGKTFDSVDSKALFEALAQINGRTVSWPEFLAAVIQRQHEDDAPEVLHIIRSNSNAASESASPGAVPHEGSDTSGESDHQDAIYHSELLQRAWEECWPNTDPAVPDSMESMMEEEIYRAQKNAWQDVSDFDHEGESHSLHGDSPQGGSPRSESSWDRMVAVRGESPATVGYAGHRFEEPEGASQELNPGCITASMNSSGPLSMVSTNEYFASGGLTYWESQERSREHRDSEEESDNLYGNELAAFQARHR